MNETQEKPDVKSLIYQWGVFIALFVGAYIIFPARVLGFLSSAVPFLIILGVLVFVHEFGHFWAAKRAGMKVHAFAIGMGPAIPGLTFKRDETTYSICAIPLGGYVRIAGMDPNEDPNEPGGFNTKPWGWRFTTLVAGCVMNFVLAALLFCALGMFIGTPTGEVTNRVDLVMPNMPAAQAGLKAGDLVVGVEDVRVSAETTSAAEVEKLRKRIEASPGRPIRVALLREGKPLEITLTPNSTKEEGKAVGRIGVSFTPVMQRVGPIQALSMGVTQTAKMSRDMLKGLGMLFTGRAKTDDIGGPVAIFKHTGDVARTGFANLVGFAAMLSINLGILNLLPIPALDGGRLIFLILEAMRLRVDPKKEAYVHAVGMVFLLLLILMITFKDLGLNKLIQGMF